MLKWILESINCRSSISYLIERKNFFYPRILSQFLFVLNSIRFKIIELENELTFLFFCSERKIAIKHTAQEMKIITNMMMISGNINQSEMEMATKVLFFLQLQTLTPLCCFPFTVYNLIFFVRLLLLFFIHVMRE